MKMIRPAAQPLSARPCRRTAVSQVCVETIESRLMLTLTALGPEFTVNTYTTDRQTLNSAAPSRNVAADALGNSVVVWQSVGQDGSNGGIYAQRLAPDGRKLGAEFRVNVTTATEQLSPTVAVAADGRFVVAWDSYQDEGGYRNVYARRYDATGNPTGGEFRVNTTTANSQGSATVGMDGAGDFVIAWQSDLQDREASGKKAASDGIYAQRFDAAGNRVGAEFRVNTYTKDAQRCPELSMDAQGNFVVVWMSDLQDGAGWGVYGQRFGPAGNKVGSEFRANAFAGGSQSFPSVALAPGGNMLVGWTSDGQSSPDFHVYARRLNADATPAGDEVRMTATPSPYANGNPRFAVSPSADILLTYQEPDPATGVARIAARHFRAAGTDFGTGQVLADVAACPQGVWEPDGTLNIFWHARGADGNTDVFGRRFAVDATGSDVVPGSTASIFSDTPIGEAATLKPLLS